MRMQIVIAIFLGLCVSTQAQSPPSARSLFLAPETLWNCPEHLLNFPVPFGTASKTSEHYQLPSYFKQTQVKSNLLNRFSIETIRTPFLAESSASIVNLWKGHFEIEGFNSTRHNVEFGPTGIDQPMRSPSHDQLGFNRAEDLSGIWLRFNFHKGAHRRKSFYAAFAPGSASAP
jgi:hypothetical protein